MDHATTMLDKFNRMLLRQARALRDMRRYAVTIVAPGQVNIGQQQLNITQSE
jgi:hypothetical protein